MQTSHEKDVVAWAIEQAQLLRYGQLSALDIEHIAEEIEDVGKSEQRELASRLEVLLTHLLTWQYQPAYQGKSWLATIKEQRLRIAQRIKESPSLVNMLSSDEWVADCWAIAKARASAETGLADFPESCLWSMLEDGWLPSALR